MADHAKAKAKAKKKRPIDAPFELCKVCNLNHNQGRKHVYFPSHARSLSALLDRFSRKLSDLRFFLDTPSVLRPEHAPLNRLWCPFCDSDLSEIGSSFACSNSIRHMAGEEHMKKVKEFLWRQGGGWTVSTHLGFLRKISPRQAMVTGHIMNDSIGAALAGGNLTQLSPICGEHNGNVHSGAPPPWLDDEEKGYNTYLVPPSGHEVKPHKSRNLNPKRVGAAWAEKRRCELEMEKKGEIAIDPCDEDWLPNFGRVWQTGSRKDSRREFEMEKQKSVKRKDAGGSKISINGHAERPMDAFGILQIGSWKMSLEEVVEEGRDGGKEEEDVVEAIGELENPQEEEEIFMMKKKGCRRRDPKCVEEGHPGGGGKAHMVIPPHIVAEAISQLHGPDGSDLRWSGPITQTETRFVEQYVHAKYPQYSQGLTEQVSTDDPLEFPSLRATSPSLGPAHPNLENTQLSPSRLLDILAKKTSYSGTFVSIPEIQARNRVLTHCGLTEREYLVLFVPSHDDAMRLVGESYPFFKHNFYMTVLDEGVDRIREFATCKESKIVCAPESWLDLRIKGSQLSQYFRRKCKHSPLKGLFAYPARACLRARARREAFDALGVGGAPEFVARVARCIGGNGWGGGGAAESRFASAGFCDRGD
ncbi:hypothetical protein QJS10_CPA10g01607 [Acorus calamus]|uniref:TITAN-like protein n=1 Tax=Acorus calamus TaxID=4465 RepID=A0AAV9E2P9_ACOCL|nr:hypothetical protein QJS10_CPA10g01607 [Acorus calamus]